MYHSYSGQQQCVKTLWTTYLGPNKDNINDLFVVNENSRSRRQFPLVQPHFTTRKYGFKSLCYQASHFWNLLDNSYKDSSTLWKWEPQCGCTDCDICVLRMVLSTMYFKVKAKTVCIYGLWLKCLNVSSSSFAHITFVSVNSHWLLFLLNIYPTLNKILLTLLTYFFTIPHF